MTTKFWAAALHIYIPSTLMMTGQGMIIPALPALGETFGVSGAIAVQVVTAQQAGRFLSLIPTGALVDRWGLRLPMITGASISTVCLIASAVCPNFLLLLLMQFIWGFGQNMWMFSREIAAAEMVNAAQRGRALSTLMGVSSAGTAFGPAVGGLLTEPLGVRGLFMIFAAVSGVVLLISLAHQSAKVDRPKQPRSMFDFGTFREIHPYYRLTYFILFVATFGVLVRTQVTNTMLPLYAQEQLGYSPTETGLLFTILGAATFAIILPAGFVSDKFGRKWVAAPAALIGGVSFLLLPAANTLLGLAFVLIFLGFASGMGMGSMTTYTFDIVPPHLRGHLQALRRTFGETGAIVGPLVAGAAAAAASPAFAFYVFVPLLLGGGVALVLMAKEGLPSKRSQDAPPPAIERSL